MHNPLNWMDEYQLNESWWQRQRYTTVKTTFQDSYANNTLYYVYYGTILPTNGSRASHFHRN